MLFCILNHFWMWLPRNNKCWTYLRDDNDLRTSQLLTIHGLTVWRFCFPFLIGRSQGQKVQEVAAATPWSWGAKGGDWGGEPGWPQQCHGTWRRQSFGGCRCSVCSDEIQLGVDRNSRGIWTQWSGGSHRICPCKLPHSPPTRRLRWRNY